MFKIFKSCMAVVEWIAIAIAAIMVIAIVLYPATARAEQVKGLKEAIVLDLGEGKIALCLPLGAYSKTEGLPLWCMFSTIPKMDEHSKKCRGIINKDGTQELLCNVKGS